MSNRYMNVKFDEITEIDELFNRVGNCIHTCLADAHGDKFDYNDYIAQCQSMLDYLNERIEQESELED